MKNLLVSFFLCIMGLFTPFAGLHRFYLEQPLAGLCYLLSWGFFGIGTVIDLFRMRKLVDDYNLRILFLKQMDPQHLDIKPSSSPPEREILRCASEHNGVVTIAMAALASSLSMTNAKSELDRLHREGFCNKDIDEDGNEIFQFTGLKPKQPLLSKTKRL